MTVPLKGTILESGTMLWVETADSPQSLIDSLRYPGPATGAASFLGQDSTTQGSWVGAYGNDGYDIPYVGTSLPGYAYGSESGGTPFNWGNDPGGTTDPSALQTPDGLSRHASTWYSTGSFSYTVNLQDSATHIIRLYCLDWQNLGRAMTIVVTDAVTNTVLDGPRSVSAFSAGIWLSWSCTGNVTFTLTATVTQAVLSGVFFDGGNALGTTLQTPIRYALNGGSALTPSHVIWADKNNADHPYGLPGVLCLLPSKVLSSDAVTFSAPSGAFATRQGNTTDTSEIVAGQTVTNLAGSDYLADPLPGPRTMRVGWQERTGAYFWPRSLYANLCKVGGPDWPDVFHTTTDSNGIATNLTGVQTRPQVISDTTSNVISFAGGPNYGPFEIAVEGTYTLLWDGTADVHLVAYDGNTTVTEVGSGTITGGANNLRTYTVAGANGNHCPSVSYTVDFSSGTFSNPRLFDHYVTDPLNPPYFHPQALAQMGAARTHRSKDVYNVESSSMVDTSDAPLDSWLTYQRTQGRDLVPVVKLEAYAPGQAWSRFGTYQLKVTTGATHSFRAGQQVQIYAADGLGGYTGGVTLPLAAGGNTGSIALTGCVYPLDSTSFVMTNVIPNGAQITTVDWSATPGITQSYSMAAPIEDPFRLPMALGSDCEAWYCFPFAASNAWATAAAQAANQWVTDSRPIKLEYANEPWNNGFKQYYHMMWAGAEFAQTADASWAQQPGEATADWADRVRWWYYVTRSRQLFETFRAEWVALGRSASQLQWVLNSWFLFPSVTTDYLNFCATHDSTGAPTGSMIPDMIAISPYFAPGQANTNIPTAAWDALTVDQVADYADVYTQYYTLTDQYASATGHITAISSAISGNASLHGATIKIGGYEGGPAKVTMGGTTLRSYQHNVAWGSHPKIRRQYQALLRIYETLGFDSFVDFACGGSLTIENGEPKAYAAFLGMSQLPGKGDGTDGLANNAALIQDGSGNPIAFDPRAVVSVQGQAIHEWLAASATRRPDVSRGRDSSSLGYSRSR